MVLVKRDKDMRILPTSIVQLREFLSHSEIFPEDREAFEEWIFLESIEFFKHKSLAEILEWAADNLLPRLEELKAIKAFSEASQVPSSSDLEDVYHWVECSVNGSPKQVAWAKEIAHRHHFAIFQAQKAGKTVPASAEWWIRNRSNIVVNLPL